MAMSSLISFMIIRVPIGRRSLSELRTAWQKPIFTAVAASFSPSGMLGIERKRWPRCCSSTWMMRYMSRGMIGYFDRTFFRRLTSSEMLNVVSVSLSVGFLFATGATAVWPRGLSVLSDEAAAWAGVSGCSRGVRGPVGEVSVSMCRHRGELGQ